jgi:tetratricopeptide (TPR) repeat protein
MNIDPIQLEARCVHLQDALRGIAHGRAVPSALTVAVMDLGRDARNAARGDLAVPILEMLVTLAPREARAWRLLGFMYGEEQRMPEAVRAFSQAAALDAEDPMTAFGHAQASLDAGFAAAGLFEHALALAPRDLAAVNGWASALAAQGDTAAAELLLEDTLRRHPDWLLGHNNLSALRWTSGDAEAFARSYAAACEVQPRNLPLRLAWMSALVQTRDWQAALKIVEDGERHMGDCPAFAVSRAVLAGESGDVGRAEEWFARTAAIRDEVLGIAHLRHCLRTGQWGRAEGLALDLLQGRAGPMIWPYLSLIWRLQGDARAQWLDGAPPYIRAFDLHYSPRELEELALVLRRLHTARAPHLEQSVRGGTQTDTHRQLFFRAEPEIQALRARVCAAIREYVAGMPAPAPAPVPEPAAGPVPAPASLPGHPLLGQQPGRILFSGSWSVRLTSQGHHVSHTHPKGWISSALYVSLPSAVELGAAPAGWIRFGVPPKDLGLNLSALGQFEPKAGQLVLFPSTMWHETLPFNDGERLVVAFDVARPRSPSGSVS